MASRIASAGAEKVSTPTSRPSTSSTKSTLATKQGVAERADLFGAGLERVEREERESTDLSPGKAAKKRSSQQSSSSNIDSLLNAGRASPRIETEEMGRNDLASTRREGTGRDHDTESSADEATNIFRRASSTALNYQSTTSQPTTTTTTEPQTQTPPQAKPRSAKSIISTQSIRRAGRVAPSHHNNDIGREGNEEDEASEHQGWWAKMISEYGSIELENKGSVARDHLALERTFLAWLRTSLAFASIGIAITQLFRLNVASHAPSRPDKDRYAALRSMGKPLGATFLGISILMLFIGFNRYFESQHWIIRGKFPASRGSIIVVGMVTFALMITSLVVVIVVEPGAREK